MKSVQIRSFFWSAFFRIWTEYDHLPRKSPYSVQIQKNTDQRNSALGHFSRSVSKYFFSLKNPFVFKFHKRIDLQNEPKANVSLIDTPKIIRQSGIEVVKEE